MERWQNNLVGRLVVVLMVVAGLVAVLGSGGCYPTGGYGGYGGYGYSYNPLPTTGFDYNTFKDAMDYRYEVQQNAYDAWDEYIRM